MTDDEDLLTVAVEATLARIAAQRDDAEQLARLRLAVWRMAHEQHILKVDIAARLQAALLKAGVPPEGLVDLGVSYSSVERNCRGPRPPG